MKRALLLTGAALALTSSLALAAPESVLPPGFGQSRPPAPAPAPAPSAASTSSAPGSASPGTSSTSPVQSAIESGTSALEQPLVRVGPVTLPEDFPSLEELEAMEDDELDELFGLKPKFDIPPAARRQVRKVGLLASDEGGVAADSLVGQPASLVKAALEGTGTRLVSRWGHIMLRRVLASRLDAPIGMDPVDFTAMRADLLLRIGEADLSRAMLQDVDTANYNARMVDSAFDSYLATGDILGMCPAVRLHGGMRKDPQWQLTQSICDAYSGDDSRATRDLNRALSRQIAPRIDVLLAQRYAGAAGEGRRAVNIEWDEVDSLSPWRFGLAGALGVEMPDALLNGAGRYYDRATALMPSMPLTLRAVGADVAAADGILSSAAMVDLYSQIAAEADIEGEWAGRAGQLRTAYIGASSGERLTAMRSLWGDRPDYGRLVLTAYAAARMPASEEHQDDAFMLISSMLTAGLDANAMRWNAQVEEGSAAWALLALADPQGETVNRDAVERFISDDESEDSRKARFLVAGLAGLGRISSEDSAELASGLEVNLDRPTRWSRYIDRAAAVRNPALVALLAGVGMQGESWEKMSARHLYHIVRSLRMVGMEAEARMIAAEAVARG